MKISIISTGGTIDKVYFDELSEFQVGSPQAEKLLHEANVQFDYEVIALLRKDSLELTDADRALIADTIRRSDCEHFVVTHGTDTMIETGCALQSIDDRVIVLTGSMQPAGLRVTDALFNVGFAMAAVQLLPEGVYVAMNGRIFDPLIARKNRAANRFEKYLG